MMPAHLILLVVGLGLTVFGGIQLHHTATREDRTGKMLACVLIWVLGAATAAVAIAGCFILYHRGGVELLMRPM